MKNFKFMLSLAVTAAFSLSAATAFACPGHADKKKEEKTETVSADTKTAEKGKEGECDKKKGKKGKKEETVL